MIATVSGLILGLVALAGPCRTGGDAQASVLR